MLPPPSSGLYQLITAPSPLRLDIAAQRRRKAAATMEQQFFCDELAMDPSKKGVYPSCTIDRFSGFIRRGASAISQTVDHAPILSAEHVSFRYPNSPDDAVCDISLQIRAGRVFGLLGPNGAGKTTLIALLTGLLLPAKGRIDVAGHAPHTGGSSCSSSLVPQHFAFYDRLSVAENLRFFARAQGLRAEALRARTDFAVQACGLNGVMKRRAAHLSGGVRRRLNLAIGLLRPVPLLFLDEPTVGIDAQSRHHILDLIRLLRDDGLTVVYTSHYMEEVQAICDDLAIIDGGRVVASGSLREILQRGASQSLRIALAAPLNSTDWRTLAERYGLSEHEGEILLEQADMETVQQLLEALQQRNATVVQLHWGAIRLEDIYVDLTRRSPRD